MWRVAGLAVFLLYAWNAFGQSQKITPDTPKSKNVSTSSASENKLIERGEYIVQGLSRCGQCHTPRNFQGEPERNHLLEGAPVWLEPARSVENWPLQAPRIAGNPPGTDAELVKLLTTGIWRDGRPLREPMPQFRMSMDDAQAVVAYLRSLTPQQR